MPELYNLTQQITTLLPQVNQKYNLKEVYNPFVNEFESNNKIMQLTEDIYDEYSITESYIYQETPCFIREILLNLQNVLGGNPKWEKWFFRKNLTKQATNVAKYETRRSVFIEIIPQSQADNLCQRWLDGLTPLFNQEPEKVLQELVEILENLLK